MTFVGIDQTGAVDSKGRPRRLRAALLRRGIGYIELELFWLRSFGLAEILQTTRSGPTELIVLIDCVLGIPEACSLPWPEPLEKLRAFPSVGYGRKIAEEFFGSLWNSQGEPHPLREVERLTRSNSVFVSRPFQKNIQTGTFRFWKDLVTDPRSKEWKVWPFSETGIGPWIFEGYPSLFWRQILQAKSRDPGVFLRWLDSQKAIRISLSDHALLSGSVDWCDAAILALGGSLLHERGRLFEPFDGFRSLKSPKSEGWIAGAKAAPLSG